MTYTLRGRKCSGDGAPRRAEMGLFRRKDPQVIDLRDHVVAKQRLAALGHAPVSVPFEFGYPTRCPACHGRGYLDHIDPFKRVQFEHCTDCGTKWDSSEDEVLALNR
jgi:hypothetical protein